METVYQRDWRRYGRDLDPFQKFVSQFHTAAGSDTTTTSTATSTTTASCTSDTLTGIPSLLHQSADHEDLTASSPSQPEKDSLRRFSKPQHSCLPYHKKFLLGGKYGCSGSTSPGEVNRGLIHLGDLLPSNLTMESRSEGEIPVIIANNQNKVWLDFDGFSTLLENTGNELRDGIDVINISECLNKSTESDIYLGSLCSSLMSRPQVSTPLPTDQEYSSCTSSRSRSEECGLNEVLQLDHRVQHHSPYRPPLLDEEEQTMCGTAPVGEERTPMDEEQAPVEEEQLS